MSRDMKHPSQSTTLKTPQVHINNPSNHESANITQDDLEPILVQTSPDREPANSNTMVQPDMIRIGQPIQPVQPRTGQPNPRTNPPIPPHTSEQGYPDVHLQQSPMVQTTQFRGNQPTFAIRSQTVQNFQDTAPSNYESSQVCLGKCTGWLGTYIPCLCCCPYPYHIVSEGFSGVVMRFGKFYKLVGPGIHYLIPDMDTLVLIDKREKVMDLKSQTVVSKDNTSFSIDSVVYYKILNTYKSKFAVANLDISLQDLAVTSLRNAVGKMTIQQFLELKDHFSQMIEEEVAHGAASWGVKVMRVLVQDVELPLEFRNSFSTGAVSKKISEAQVIHAKADVEVAKLMKDAADQLNSDAAFQIRYISALEAISNDPNPKMIFFPSDYNDVGGANAELIYSMHEENEGLIKK